MLTCEHCDNPHDGSYGSGRFCTCGCARAFSTTKNRQEINKKVSEKLRHKFIDRHDDVTFSLAVSQAKTWRHLGRLLELGDGGNIQSHLRQRVADLKLDTLHFKKYLTPKERLTHQPNGPKGKLRHDLIRIGRKYECEGCGLGPWWNGKNLTIQVDHKDGNRNDNTPENLRFLCPNCHSQTPTFCSLNTKTCRAKRETVQSQHLMR